MVTSYHPFYEEHLLEAVTRAWCAYKLQIRFRRCFFSDKNSAVSHVKRTVTFIVNRNI